jgi:hypothetical protein
MNKEFDIVEPIARRIAEIEGDRSNSLYNLELRVNIYRPIWDMLHGVKFGHMIVRSGHLIGDEW